jgi:hypothetical protein
MQRRSLASASTKSRAQFVGIVPIGRPFAQEQQLGQRGAVAGLDTQCGFVGIRRFAPRTVTFEDCGKLKTQPRCLRRAPMPPATRAGDSPIAKCLRELGLAARGPGKPGRYYSRRRLPPAPPRRRAEGVRPLLPHDRAAPRSHPSNAATARGPEPRQGACHVRRGLAPDRSAGAAAMRGERCLTAMTPGYERHGCVRR